MSRHRHEQLGAGQAEVKGGHPQDVRQQKVDASKSSSQSSKVDMTPGRAPAEGGEIESPSHERWEQGTPERAPAEGPDTES